MKNKDYPDWSCYDCGTEHGAKAPKKPPKNWGTSTWHYGKCDICNKNAPVTQPRDFGHFKDWFKK